MSRSSAVAVQVVTVLALLHQDSWLWNDATLLFGFLPAGLAWHAAFSVVAAAVWLGVVMFAWPSDPLGDDA